MKFEGVAIAGYGQTPYHKRPDKPTEWYVVEAVRRALASCGIHKNEVDGLGVSSFFLPPDNTATMAEQMGMALRWGFLGTFGGASQVIALLRAARAIENGDAEVIVLVAADAYSVETHTALMDNFNTGMRDYLVPYGFGGTNGLFAMVERRHRHEFGTTKEALGKFAVTQRQHASLNDNALLRDPMTMDDYLNSRLICDPIRLFDCVLPCGGGEAVVVTSVERARATGRTPVRLLSGDERTNHAPDQVIVLEGAWAQFSDRLFDDAGIGHDDVDLVELYDDYPIMNLIQIEGLGFAPRGEGGRFIEATDISIEGALPINTGGGQLSCGQSGAGGGGIGLTEAVMQLQGEAGRRQVRDPQFGLVSGFGMVGFVKGLCGAAAILTTN
jgi:acetyl-CoA acetyltransferase